MDFFEDEEEDVDDVLPNNALQEEKKKEEPLHMNAYTCSELLQKTKKSEEKRKTRGGGGGGHHNKLKPSRIWSPDGEYEIVRSGPTLLMDPDECKSTLQERTMTLFKHTNPEVKFGEDNRTPLWKGVFKMHPDLGYEEDQYYNPKQEHLRIMYTNAERVKKNKPVNNLITRRDGGEPLPYWVDDWQHVKNNEQQHKQNSKKRKAQREAAEAAEAVSGPSSEAIKKAVSFRKPVVQPAPKRASRKDASQTMPTVIPTDDRYIFPLSGWMKSKTSTKGAPKLAVDHSSMLKQSPAIVLSKNIRVLAKEIGKSPDTATLPAPGAQSKEEEEEEEVEASPLPQKTKATTQPKKQQRDKKRARPDEDHGDVAPASKPNATVTAANDTLLKMKLAKSQYNSAQYEAYTNGDTGEVHPAYAMYLSGKTPVDPAELLSDFIRYMEERHML